MEKDLQYISLHLNNANVEAAIGCMVGLAVNITYNTDTLLTLLQKCFEGVMKIIQIYEQNVQLITMDARMVR